MSEANSTGVSTSLTSGESKTSSTIKIDELLSACLFLAKESGVVIRAIYERGANKNFTDKRVTSGSESVEEDPQTEADLHSQRIIIGSLKTLYPNLTIIGEEGKVDWNPEDVVKPDLSLCAEIKTLPADKLVVPVEDVRIRLFPKSERLIFSFFFRDAVPFRGGSTVSAVSFLVRFSFPFPCFFFPTNLSSPRAALRVGGSSGRDEGVRVRHHGHRDYADWHRSQGGCPCRGGIQALCGQGHVGRGWRGRVRRLQGEELCRHESRVPSDNLYV